MLNEKDLAILTNKLEAPMAVTDILNDPGEFTDVAHYALHEIISDLQPDSALLAIALSARKIAGFYIEASAGMKVMAIECDRIIGDYGPLWIRNARNQNLNQDSVLDILVHTSEDLESIAELLDLNACFLRAKDETAATLCDILQIQAAAHAVIAEEFISIANAVGSEMAARSAAMPIMTGNVIPFPGLYQNR